MPRTKRSIGFGARKGRAVEAPAEEKPAGDAAPAVDDRLAALAARSKAAREKKAAEAG